MAKINSNKHRRKSTAGWCCMFAWLHRYHNLPDRKRSVLASGHAGKVGRSSGEEARAEMVGEHGNRTVRPQEEAQCEILRSGHCQLLSAYSLMPPTKGRI